MVKTCNSAPSKQYVAIAAIFLWNLSKTAGKFPEIFFFLAEPFYYAHTNYSITYRLKPNTGGLGHSAFKKMNKYMHWRGETIYPMARSHFVCLPKDSKGWLMQLATLEINPNSFSCLPTGPFWLFVTRTTVSALIRAEIALRKSFSLSIGSSVEQTLLSHSAETFSQKWGEYLLPGAMFLRYNR